MLSSTLTSTTTSPLPPVSAWLRQCRQGATGTVGDLSIVGHIGIVGQMYTVGHTGTRSQMGTVGHMGPQTLSDWVKVA